MKYKAELKFSDDFVKYSNLDHVKRYAATQVIMQMPIEHLDALFNFDITYHSQAFEDTPEYKHDLLAYLKQIPVNQIDSIVETTL